MCFELLLEPPIVLFFLVIYSTFVKIVNFCKRYYCYWCIYNKMSNQLIKQIRECTALRYYVIRYGDRRFVEYYLSDFFGFWLLLMAHSFERKRYNQLLSLQVITNAIVDQYEASLAYLKQKVSTHMHIYWYTYIHTYINIYIRLILLITNCIIPNYFEHTNRFTMPLKDPSREKRRNRNWTMLSFQNENKWIRFSKRWD